MPTTVAEAFCENRRPTRLPGSPSITILLGETEVSRVKN